MANYSRIIISAVELILKTCVVRLIAFSVFGLFMQFIFSYFNQSIYGPHLTYVNFAGPLLLTVVILFITGLYLLFKVELKKIRPFNAYIKIILSMLLLILLSWQIWYTISYYKMTFDLDFIDRMNKLLPIIVGIFSTAFLTITILKKRHIS